MLQVEDDLHVEPILQRLLGQEDYEVKTVRTADLVLPALEEHPGIRVVVSDSFAKHLAGEVKVRFRVPFVVYSGRGREEVEGVTQWIEKPNPGQLKEKIEEYCKDE